MFSGLSPWCDVPCQPPVNPDSGKLAPLRSRPSMKVIDRVMSPSKRKRHQVVHQPEVLVLALRQAERDVAVRLLHRVLHRDLDAPLDLADVVDVGIDAHLVAGAKTGLERAELPDDGVENAGVALAIAQPLLGAGAVAEQPLEHHTRVHLRRQRLVGDAHEIELVYAQL